MVTTSTPHTAITADQAVTAARSLIADELPDLVGAGMPWRMRSPLGGVWIVPLWIAYPGHDRPSTVGSVAVDETSGYIVSWTPADEVLANAARFRERNAEALAAGLESSFGADSGA
jgi:hypothetical protein